MLYSYEATSIVGETRTRETNPCHPRSKPPSTNKYCVRALTDQYLPRQVQIMIPALNIAIAFWLCDLREAR